MRALNIFNKRLQGASLEGILQNADKKNFPRLQLGRHFLKHKKGGRGNSPRNKLLKGANRGSYIRRPFLYQKLLQETFFLLQKVTKFLMPSKRGSLQSFIEKSICQKSLWIGIFSANIFSLAFYNVTQSPGLYTPGSDAS